MVKNNHSKDQLNFSGAFNFKKLVAASMWSIRTGIRIHKPLYFTFFISQVLQTTLPVLRNLLFALILGVIVDIVSNGSSLEDSSLNLYLIFLFLTLLIEQINMNLVEYSLYKFKYKFDMEIGSMYLNKSLELEMEYHENSEFNIFKNKASEAVNWRIFQITRSSVVFTANVISLLLISGVFVLLNPLLLFLIFIPVIINFLINKKFGTLIFTIWQYKGEEKKHAGHARNSLYHDEIIKEAKIYGFGKHLVDRFRLANVHFNNEVGKKLNNKFRSQFFAAFIEIGMFFGIQYWLIRSVVDKSIAVSSYSFYMSNILNVSQNLVYIQEEFSRIYDHAQYVYDAKVFFSLENKIKTPEKPKKVDVAKAPSIEFKNVTFRYQNADEDNYVIKNLSFKINAGESVALVGENGAGKSTIIKLLARFYDPTEGEILVNGVNIKEYDLDEYYKLWGVLFQVFAKYWFSLRENIGLGNIEDIENIDLIKSAGSNAGVDKFLHKLKHGYENMLNTDFEDGTQLSGGEWQKVGIARGIFASPKLIIMDEPTSALDALAEAKIFEELDKIASDATMIIVSHRFATVRNADRIIVIEEGSIKENGTHEQLMKNKDVYYNMFTTQAAGYK